MKLKELKDITFFKQCDCKDSYEVEMADVIDILEVGIPACPECGKEYSYDEEQEI